jgi:L-aspartate oxidase
LVLTKGHPLQSSSIQAQGGVAVALSEEDDVAIHLTDTLKAGHGLCRKEAVRVLVEEDLHGFRSSSDGGPDSTKRAANSPSLVRRRTAAAVS